MIRNNDGDRDRPLLFQDLPFVTQDLVLPPQSRQLGALIAGEPGATP